MVNLTLKIQTRDNFVKRLRARRDAKISELLGEIRNKIPEEFPRNEPIYVWLEGYNRPLPTEASLQEFDDELVLIVDRKRPPLNSNQVNKRKLTQHPSKKLDAIRVVLKDVTLEQEYPIQWNPTRIGRRNQETEYSEIRPLFLSEDDHPSEYSGISRDHIILLMRDNNFYLIHATPKNVTFLNEEQLKYMHAYELQNGDTIQLGKTQYIYQFKTH